MLAILGIGPSLYEGGMRWQLEQRAPRSPVSALRYRTLTGAGLRVTIERDDQHKTYPADHTARRHAAPFYSAKKAGQAPGGQFHHIST
jgi:hypothetical protein